MARRQLFLVSSTLASFITPFVSTAVNIALPSITSYFGVDAASVNWFANVFLISLASTILVVGVVADWVGRERLFVSGVFLFMISSLLILFTRDFTTALVLRALQGLGSAMISGIAVAILASLFPRETGFVIGINTAAVYVGTTLGPVLGGFLVNYTGWSSIFLFTGSVALASSVLALLSLDLGKKRSGKKPRFETLALFTISLIMISTGSAYIKSLSSVSSLLAGLALFTATLYIEYRGSINLVKQIFERRVFLAYLVALLNYLATFALSILYSNYLQLRLGLTPLQTGLVLVAQPLPQVILSPLAGYLADKWEPGILVTIGMALISLGIGLSIATYKWLSLLIISLVLIGAGFAFFASPNTTQIVRRIPREAYASATSFLGLMRFLGQSLSTSILTSVITLLKDPAPMKTSLTIYLAASIAGLLMAIASIQKRSN